jgi:hypothetical protein
MEGVEMKSISGEAGTLMGGYPKRGNAYVGWGGRRGELRGCLD